MTSQRPIYLYALLLLVMLFFLYQIFYGGVPANISCNNWVFILPILWVLGHIVVWMLMLRRVEVREDGLVIYGLQAKETLAYRDILWVVEMTNNRGPSWACCKFFDRQHQKNRFLFYMPRNFWGIGESELTQLIRRRIQRANPNYRPESEPSKWLLNGLVFLANVPMFLIFWLECSGGH